MMTLLEPVWLLVVLPAGLLAWRLRPAGRTQRLLRWTLYGLVVLAMAEPAWWRAQRAGTVVVVADRSASMPAHAAAAQLEAVNLLHDAMDPARHRLAVLTFGQRAAVELPPGVETLPALAWFRPTRPGACCCSATAGPPATWPPKPLHWPPAVWRWMCAPSRGRAPATRRCWTLKRPRRWGRARRSWSPRG